MVSMPKYLEVLSDSLWAKAIRRGLILLIPLIIAGSLALVINNFPVAAYQSYMVQAFGENWKMAGEIIDNLTFGIIGLALTGTVCFNAIEELNSRKGGRIHSYQVSLCGIISFFILTNKGTEGLLSNQVGNNSIFIAILVAIATTELFVRFHSRSGLWFKPEVIDADPSLNKALTAIIPFLFIIIIFISLRISLIYLGIDSINEFLSNLLENIFLKIQQPLVSILLYLLVSQFLWFFGIHGSKLLYAVNDNIYLEASKVNAYIHAAGGTPDNIVTKSFLDAFIIIGGSGATIALIAAILLSSQKGSSRVIAKYSLLPSIFNINELIVFGLPIVLNPFFILPFIAVPVVLALVSYYATYIGFLPVTIADVNWTTPPLLSGYLATGSYKGVLMQIFNIGLGILIYLPFVKLFNNYRLEARRSRFKLMVSTVLSDSCKADKKHLERNDEVGYLARAFVADISRAIDCDELYLKYQPQVNKQGLITGFEALLRWNHHLYGEIPPLLIVALAEEAGLINQIGKVVLNKALKQQALWQSIKPDQIKMSINLSPSQLKDGDLQPTLHSLVEAYSLNPELIELEFTESVEITATAETREIMESLKKMGFKLAMDDFGMGHTSLLYLRLFTVDTIKIDGSLTCDVVTDKNSQDIISTLAFLSKSTEADLVAEYVETEEQWQILIELGCQYFQGYLFSEPVLADNATLMIKESAFVK